MESYLIKVNNSSDVKRFIDKVNKYQDKKNVDIEMTYQGYVKDKSGRKYLMIYAHQTLKDLQRFTPKNRIIPHAITEQDIKSRKYHYTGDINDWNMIGYESNGKGGYDSLNKKFGKIDNDTIFKKALRR